MTTPARPQGLRERKLQRTRARLIEAAVSLCLSDGYESATVEAIAAAAEVSPRTFSRYFATKDAVFLAVLEGLTERVIDEMKEQADDLSPLEALRSAHIAAITRASDQSGPQSSGDEISVILRVISSSDVLLQKVIEYRDERLTKALADRAGVPTDDLGLQLAMALYSVVSVTTCARLVNDTPRELLGPAVLVERLNSAFAQVAELANGLDPSLGYQTRTQSTSMSAG